jgi:hypothetical protein
VGGAPGFCAGFGLNNIYAEEGRAFTEPGQFTRKTDVFPAQCPSRFGLVNQILSVKALPSSAKML